jgi:hypothetical protein
MAYSGRFTTALPGLATCSLAVLFSLTAVESVAAEPQRVGVAAAVKPQAESTPPGATTRTLKIGKNVVYNERIDTSDSGVVQVLLLDGSTFTVGPRSSLVIDKFVYNPATGSGELAASFSKGALRFVGGKLSKGPRGISVRTPAGAVTVRGGIFQGVVHGSNQALFAFVFGHHLSLKRGGWLYTLSRPGNVFAISGAGAPLIRPTTPADSAMLLAAVSGQKTKFASRTKPKGKGWPYYYGIQPAGRYPDQPFVRELYYDGAFGDRARAGLRRVQVPEISKSAVVQTPVVQTPPVIPPVTTPGGPTLPGCVPACGPGVIP